MVKGRRCGSPFGNTVSRWPISRMCRLAPGVSAATVPVKQSGSFSITSLAAGSRRARRATRGHARFAGAVARGADGLHPMVMADAAIDDGDKALGQIVNGRHERNARHHPIEAVHDERPESRLDEQRELPVEPGAREDAA